MRSDFYLLTIEITILALQQVIRHIQTTFYGSPDGTRQYDSHYKGT